MDFNLRNDIYTLARIVPMYANEFQRLFDFLNGKVNPMNNCIGIMAYYSPKDFACFQYPNYVTIYAASIVDHFYENFRSHDKIMSAAALCITHELFHADQCVDSYRYKQEAAYCTNVENAAEYGAEIWCQAHKTDFKKYFGFDYCFEVGSDQGVYQTHDETYPQKFILGTFRSSVIEGMLDNLMSKHDNVGIRIHDTTQHRFFLAKMNGQVEISPDAFDAMNIMLRSFKPRNLATTYEMTVDIMTGENKTLHLENVKILDIEVTKMEFSPFPFD